MKKINYRKKNFLLAGVLWLVSGIIATIFEPKNIFCTLFLGLGIFFGGYVLHKTHNL